MGRGRGKVFERAKAQAQTRLAGAQGRTFWRGLEELAETPDFRRALTAEFPHAFVDLTATDRRGLLRVLAGSLALGGLSACSDRPDPNALPYVNTPEHLILGEARHYATAVTFAGYAQPVLGETHEGRPTKLEGLPDHPASLGATDAFTQAALLGLYDPDRSQAPMRHGEPAAWDAFDRAMVENAARLDARQGEGFRLLTGAVSSPTLVRQIEAMLARWPRARWHVFEPVDDARARQAVRLAFGRPLATHLRLEACRFLVCLDADPLGPGPHQTVHGRRWSARRQAFQAGEAEQSLLVAEAAPTLTGAMAADRLSASPAEVERLVLALAAAFEDGRAPAGLPPRQAQWLTKAAEGLRRAGPEALILVGPHHRPEVQAAALRLNAQLGATGRTLILSEPILADPGEGGALEALCADVAAGRVDTLAILDANPAYAAPADLKFAALMDQVPVRLHAGLHYDETARLCQWHAPLAHELETWSDARAVDGRTSLIQPLVQPFYPVRSRHVLLENLQGRLGAEARAPVAETWRERLGAPETEAWRAALRRGFLDDPAQSISVAAAAAGAPIQARTEAGLTLLIRPDPTVWDGRFAHNPWLQELPKPFSKLTWDNAIWVSPALARELELANGDLLRVRRGERRIEGPVWIVPGQSRRTLVAHLGYGRRTPDHLADGAGYDAGAIRTSEEAWRIDGVAVERVGGRVELASTQLHSALDGHDFVRTAARAEAAPAPPEPEPPSFYPEWEERGPQWGMSIDTDLCIACNACVTACVAENNIPMVGKDQVAKGREMHWLRIDQYHSGDVEDPLFFNQPVPCMHCEQAPCEMGCPVNAAVHDHEGLNLQVYNRCIGTRTCSSYCPYKVRRFNWFDFTGGDPPELQAARNPDVTVRDRGVMEKCTYCIQRISEARIEAKKAGRPIAEGEVKTACQQVCPTDAIVFGRVDDPQSAVSRRKAQSRSYSLLEEVNTRPRTTYLARLTDDDAEDGDG